MSSALTDCPELSLLRGYLRGEVTAEQLEIVSCHLKACSSCMARLAELDQVESAPLPTPATTSTDPLLERAMYRLLDPKASGPLTVLTPASPGDKIGEYRLLEQLGEGGMGTTFKAVHLKLDRLVALKILRPALIHDRAAVSRFQREMRAIGKLHHPNIVLALDAGEVSGHLYLAMELVTGETLSQRVRRLGALPIDLACRVAWFAAQALDHAHAAGLVHRDVKPSNLMLTRDGAVKLLDLGLVRLLINEPSTATGEIEMEPSKLSDAAGAIGTSDYMAPEQWRCSTRIDARADQYGLGCTLFYLLVGKPPFSGENSRTPYDKMQLHLNEPPPSLRKIRPEVPLYLERIVERLMAKRPADRFSSMTEVASLLAQAVQGESPSLPAAVAKPRPRYPHWVPLLGLALLFCVTLGSTAAFMYWPRISPIGTVETGRKLPRPPGIGRLPLTHEAAVELQQAWATYLGRSVVERHPSGVDFILIPPGQYSITPQTTVVLSQPYQMARTEITVAQFRSFVEDSGYVTEAETSGWGNLPPPDLVAGKQRLKEPGLCWSNPGYPGQTPEHPVVQVTWDDAVAYCQWLAAQDGMTYQLPTEWEWNWACRAGTAGPLPCPEKDLPDYLWYRNNSEMKIRPVGGKKPNPWGLVDMLGNAHEWISNTTTKLSAGTILDPPGEQDRVMRHICGGGIDTQSPHFGYWERFSHNYPYVKIGFRVLRKLPSPIDGPP